MIPIDAAKNGSYDADLRDALARLRGKALLSLVNDANRIEVRRGGRGVFEFTLQPVQSRFWRNYTLVSSEPIDLQTAIECLLLARANDQRWLEAIDWRMPRKRHQGRIAGLIAFAVFGIPYAIFGGYALYTKAPGVDAKTFWIGLAAVVAIAGYIAWLDFFFGPVRHGLARIVGQRLGGHVSESYGLDAGAWNIETPDRESLGRTVYANVLVRVIDFAVLMVATLLPVTVVCTVLFVVFDK